MSWEGTPLHEAAEINDLGEVKRLLDSGAEVDSVDLLGKTPLHLITSAEAAKILIDHGAKIDADNIDKTPLYLAAKRGDKEIVSFLLAHGGTIGSHSLYRINQEVKI